MTDPLFYEYYDTIYSVKDYSSEVSVILNIYKTRLKTVPRSILDVGCGTGNHSILFADQGCRVVGVDLDDKMIEIAKKKPRPAEDNPAFYCMDVSDVPRTRFDLAVSMFNVISYIRDIGTLKAFFKSISKKLSVHGLFIFDCWNGLAAILDPPKIKKSKVKLDNETIEIETFPDMNLMDQMVKVKNLVTVKKNGQKKRFEYDYTQYLWTPSTVTMILKENGFDKISVVQDMKQNISAKHNTWKIMFICGKD